MQNSLFAYYEEYNCFVEDQLAMEEALERISDNDPIELVIIAHGNAKSFQRKAIEHIKNCLNLAPTAEEKEKLILELDTIQRLQAA